MQEHRKCLLVAKADSKVKFKTKLKTENNTSHTTKPTRRYNDAVLLNI